MFEFVCVECWTHAGVRSSVSADGATPNLLIQRREISVVRRFFAAHYTLKRYCNRLPGRSRFCLSRNWGVQAVRRLTTTNSVQLSWYVGHLYSCLGQIPSLLQGAISDFLRTFSLVSHTWTTIRLRLKRCTFEKGIESRAFQERDKSSHGPSFLVFFPTRGVFEYSPALLGEVPSL